MVDLTTYPRVGFYFKLIFMGVYGAAETSFKEVSGLSMEMETEEIAEGGVNDFKHRVPKIKVKQNLILKRGFNVNSSLTNWCEKTIAGGLTEQISTNDITINLLNEESIPIKSWTVYDAYPIKWEISGLDSMKNEIIIESLEFAYSSFKTII